MKNFPITNKDGKVYWISRSVAIVAAVFKTIDNTTYVLANQRGKGAPDYNFKWNITCGYIDFDESGEEACARELLEETGVIVNNPNNFIHVMTKTVPTETRQNIVLRYVLKPDSSIIEPEIFNPKTLVGGEKDEVNDIKWIPLNDVNKYEWAFGHETIIFEMYEEYKKLEYIDSICEQIGKNAIPYNQVSGLKSYTWLTEETVETLISKAINELKINTSNNE